MKYRFVLKDKGTKNQGWWLKISTQEELKDYLKNTVSPVVDGFKSLINCREFSTSQYQISNLPLKPHVTRSGYMLGLYAQNHNINPIQAAVEMDIKKIQLQSDYIDKGYNIYINKNNGWHFGINDFSEWYDTDKLIFPEFKKDQIRIEKFPLGKHYYAYIDNMQVRNGDILKWDTYDEAYHQALSIIQSQDT